MIAHLEEAVRSEETRVTRRIEIAWAPEASAAP